MVSAKANKLPINEHVREDWLNQGFPLKVYCQGMRGSSLYRGPGRRMVMSSLGPIFTFNSGK